MDASRANPSVLLTGATGFIGSRVAHRLVNEGCVVFALVRPGSSRWRLPVSPQVQVVEGDLQRLEECASFLERNAPEVLIHAAWHAQPGSYLTDPGNLSDVQMSI